MLEFTVTTQEKNNFLYETTNVSKEEQFDQNKKYCYLKGNTNNTEKYQWATSKEDFLDAQKNGMKIRSCTEKTYRKLIDKNIIKMVEAIPLPNLQLQNLNQATTKPNYGVVNSNDCADEPAIYARKNQLVEAETHETTKLKPSPY